MRNVRRSPRQVFRVSSLCHECEEASRAPSESSQGEHTVGFSLSPDAAAKSVTAGIDINDPNVHLANIIVELEDGCVERVRMGDHESAEEVAKNVCRKNELPDKFAALLAEHIIGRYPERPVDKKKEGATVHSEDTKSVKSSNESSISKKG